MLTRWRVAADHHRQRVIAVFRIRARCFVSSTNAVGTTTATTIRNTTAATIPQIQTGKLLPQTSSSSSSLPFDEGRNNSNPFQYNDMGKIAASSFTVSTGESTTKTVRLPPSSSSYSSSITTTDMISGYLDLTTTTMMKQQFLFPMINTAKLNLAPDSPWAIPTIYNNKYRHTIVLSSSSSLLRFNQFIVTRDLRNTQMRAFSSSAKTSNDTGNDNDKSNPEPPAAASIRLPPTASPPHIVQGRPPMPRKLGRVQVPTPEKALPPEAKPGGWRSRLEPRRLLTQTAGLLKTVVVTLATYAYKTPYWTYYYIRHADERRAAWQSLVEMARHEAQHYWNGTKLLVADIRTARRLVGKTLDGNALTRRERKQLLRTVSDLFRLVPFSMFVLIPFMEFALPFALRIFPNLLPSTFQDSLKAEETMKRELQSRIAMAQFFQETMETLAQEQKKKAVRRRQELEEQAGDASEEHVVIHKQEDSAASMLEFLNKARNGEMMPPDVIIRYANYFQDDLTLDNMPRMQLINMCRYMNIPPYGSDSFLRFQLRHRIRSLKEDDQRILWEGIDSLTKMELREAVQERGMRSTGLSKDAYKRALQQWLDLSVNKNVPIALLIMSRTFFLQDEIPPLPSSSSTAGATTKDSSNKDSTGKTGTSAKDNIAPKMDSASTQKTATADTTSEKVPKQDTKGGGGGGASTDDKSKSDASLTGLADAISGLDQEVLNEVILQMATSEEKTSDPEIRKLKLEVLEKQNELIRKEQQDREVAKKQLQAAAAEAATASESSSDGSKVVSEADASGKKKKYTTEAPATDSSIPTTETEEKGDESDSSSSSTTSTTVGDGTLTTEEMDALRTILTDDPVSSEREALQKIKAAMKGDIQPDQREELQRIRESIESHAKKPSKNGSMNSNGTTASAQAMTPEEADAYVADQIKEQDHAAASMSESTSTTYRESARKDSSSSFSSSKSPQSGTATEASHSEEEADDPIVARLKQRVESMVNKIELQLSETQVKIGDKMHLLDKDRDGILTREEVAQVLQQVFKKNISFDEAMEIADEMDDNHDGIFTVDELLQWVDKHRLVRFVEEGMDVDLDKLMASETKESNMSSKDSSSESSPNTSSSTNKTP